MNLLIVILTYNESEYTIQAVNNCLAIKVIEPHILVIDNCSPKPDINATIKHEFQNNKRVEIIRKDTNDGYSGGNNFGLKIAKERGYKYCWILNNDIKFVNHAFIIDNLKFLNNNCQISVIGHRIFNFSNSTLSEINNDSFIYKVLTIDNTYFKKAPKSLKNRYLKKNRVNGCSLIIRIEDLDKLGYLNSSFFMYGEEDDFCLRAWRNNKCVYEDYESEIFHYGSGSRITKRNSWIISLMIRNKLLIMNEYNFFIRSIAILLFFISILRTSIKYLFGSNSWLSLLYVKKFIFYTYKISFSNFSISEIQKDTNYQIRTK